MPPRLPRRMLPLRAVVLALAAPWMCACTDAEERSSPAQQERRDAAHDADPAREKRDDDGLAGSTGAAEAASFEPSSAWTGPAMAWKSDDGVLSAELRQGWTIARAEAGRVLVDPGLRPTDTLDCLLVVVWGELDESQRALDAAGIMQAQDEIRAWFYTLQEEHRTPANLQQKAIESMHHALDALDTHGGPEDLLHYAEFVLSTATRVARAAREGDVLGVGGQIISRNEQEFIQQLEGLAAARKK